MRELMLFLIFTMLLACSKSDSEKVNELDKRSNTVLPFQIRLTSPIKGIKDVQSSNPMISLDINIDSIKITVGYDEEYLVNYQETELSKLIEDLRIEDFKSSKYYFHPYLPNGGSIELVKTIEDTVYEKKISSFIRRDKDISYLKLDSTDIHTTYHLSKIANEIVTSFMQDTISESEMFTARSMREALMKPEQVYKLTLRNTRTKNLSSNIRKLKNLRILDISGSFITAIPDEIKECIHLKSILANASQLSYIPPSIGELTKLRVINFAACKIKSIPKEIGDIKFLWSLSLGSNEISTLPENISNLKNLTFFSIANNRLREFPRAVLGLENVGNLWMHGNQFNMIPEEIVRLKSLHHFLLSVDRIDNVETIKEVLPNVMIIDQE